MGIPTFKGMLSRHTMGDMARRAFFSFHYERDLSRAGQVRSCWPKPADWDAAGFCDAASWEALKSKGDEVVNKWISDQLEGTTVTVVLIGTETATTPYVQYAIDQSWARNNELIGIHISSLKDSQGNTQPAGTNPLQGAKYSEIRTYDWTIDSGYQNVGDWIESAYQRAQDRKLQGRVNKVEAEPRPNLNATQAFDIISAYGTVLEKTPPLPGCVDDSRKLPYPKSVIKEALLIVLREVDDPATREHLKFAYMSLASFQDGVGAFRLGVVSAYSDSNEDPRSRAKRVAAQQAAVKKWLPLVKREEAQSEQELRQLDLG
jgi:hypothetical protein